MWSLKTSSFMLTGRTRLLEGQARSCLCRSNCKTFSLFPFIPVILNHLNAPQTTARCNKIQLNTAWARICRLHLLVLITRSSNDVMCGFLFILYRAAMLQKRPPTRGSVPVTLMQVRVSMLSFYFPFSQRQNCAVKRTFNTLSFSFACLK